MAEVGMDIVFKQDLLSDDEKERKNEEKTDGNDPGGSNGREHERVRREQGCGQQR